MGASALHLRMGLSEAAVVRVDGLAKPREPVLHYHLVFTFGDFRQIVLVYRHMHTIAIDRVTGFRAVHPGAILCEELKERGIKQKELAERIGIQASHLNEIIKGTLT